MLTLSTMNGLFHVIAYGFVGFTTLLLILGVYYSFVFENQESHPSKNHKSPSMGSLASDKTASIDEYGTIEGRLEMVTIRDRMECSVYDDLTDHRVRCFFKEDMLQGLLVKFGKRVVAVGQITSYAGRAETVRLESVQLAESPRDISMDTFFGLGRDWFDDISAANLVHGVWHSDEGPDTSIFPTT